MYESADFTLDPQLGHQVVIKSRPRHGKRFAHPSETGNQPRTDGYDIQSLSLQCVSRCRHDKHGACAFSDRRRDELVAGM